MTETITVASHAPMAIQRTEPVPAEHAGKPQEELHRSGIIDRLRSFFLHGSRHESAPGDVSLTHGVDAEVFRAWYDANQTDPLVVNRQIYEVSEDEAKRIAGGAMEYGHEPALKRLSEDAENSEKAEKGSTVDHGAPVKATEMAAESHTPNDDSPRSDVGPNGGVVDESLIHALHGDNVQSVPGAGEIDHRD